MDKTDNFHAISHDYVGYINDIRREYERDPQSVSLEWRAWFSGFANGFSAARQVPSAAVRPDGFNERSLRLLQAYARLGYRAAALDPLGTRTSSLPELEPAAYGFMDGDWARVTDAGKELGWQPMPLTDLLTKLDYTFCGSVGVEFEQVDGADERRWLYAEAGGLRTPLPSSLALQMFSELAGVDAFEKTLATKYVGKKRFSLEGGDALVPALESVIDAVVAQGARELMLGMAHRGRLVTLVNVVKLPFEYLVSEFEGEYPPQACCNDVKYHCGYWSRRQSRSGTDCAIFLGANASHLEAIGPIILGDTRARQEKSFAGESTAVVPVLVHGDAAVAGQGVVYETMQMSGLPGFSVGGTIHVVVNNQVGFTTSPANSRTSFSCTDVAKVTGAPVIHVNAEDLTAVHRVCDLAGRYRQKFGKDIFIDLVCFRRFGHNESDEPRFTQPLEYRRIDSKPPPWELEMAQLGRTRAGDPTFSAEALRPIYQQARASYLALHEKVKSLRAAGQPVAFGDDYDPPVRPGVDVMLAPVATCVRQESLISAGQRALLIPDGFRLHRKIKDNVLAERARMLTGERLVDWGMAEILAYGSLLDEGVSVRLCGQDSGRGTFSHRHVVLVDQENGERIVPLQNGVARGDARFAVVDSLLSEYAVLAYEYGYSRTDLDALVIWEAQFGDFCNGAQIIFDQFISSGECKWSRAHGLVMYLPHGMEGQGAEHSSARLERFLQLAGNANMFVCNLSSAAQLFHALRRQIKAPYRKPLVLMTPKSLLRAPEMASPLDDLVTGGFQTVIDDGEVSASQVKRIVFSSGKFAHNLLSARRGGQVAGGEATAVVRIEQLYPLDSLRLLDIVARYPQADLWVWAQEEGRNMGAWSALAHQLEALRAQMIPQGRLIACSREVKASPAGGLEHIHHRDQARLVWEAFSCVESVEV